MCLPTHCSLPSTIPALPNVHSRSAPSPTCFSSFSVNWRGSASFSHVACASALSAASRTACGCGEGTGGMGEWEGMQGPGVRHDSLLSLQRSLQPPSCPACAGPHTQPQACRRPNQDTHCTALATAVASAHLGAALRGALHRQPRLLRCLPGQPHKLGGGGQEGGVQHGGQVVLWGERAGREVPCGGSNRILAAQGHWPGDVLLSCWRAQLTPKPPFHPRQRPHAERSLLPTDSRTASQCGQRNSHDNSHEDSGRRTFMQKQ